MGCKWNKTSAVFPTDTIKTEKQPLENAEWTAQNDSVTVETTSERAESKLNEKIKSSQSSSKSNELLLPSPSMNNGAELMLTRQASPVRSTSAGTPKPNVKEEVDPGVDSTDSKTGVQWRIPKRTVVTEAIISKNTVETVLDDTNDEFEASDFHDDDAVNSSSSSIDAEKSALRQDTLVRFSSAMPKQYETEQGTLFDGISNGSDESYPLHDSIVTSTPSDMEASLVQSEFIDESTHIDRKTSSVQENTPAREIMNQSDETDSYFEASANATSRASKKMTVHRRAIIESGSLNLNKSDSQQQKIVYETSSDCSEF